jgi:hypothetical protein
MPLPSLAVWGAALAFFCSSSSFCSGIGCLNGLTLPLTHGQVVRFSLITPAHFNCRNTGTPGPLPLNPFILPASTPRETTGLHSPETKFEMKTPAIQTSFLSSSSQPASATLSPSTPSSSALGDERVSSQRHRLQTLFEELHRENTAASGASGNSLRVVELHGRIAELVRLENENSGGRVIHVDEVEQVPPPAYYEPD